VLIPTLHRYLGRDLVRTVALAALALTVIVTTFAVIEPLRKEGLNASQTLMLFWYLLPVMLSLTLPIAAVFAATFTYGRFAMDNELTACRAGGVSRYALLKPGIALGVAVGIATLVLSNWVAPKLAREGQATVIANVRGLFYQKLRTESQFRKGSWIIRADSVDPDGNQLQGVVAVDVDDVENVSFYTATLAAVDFSETDGHHSVTVSAIHPAHGKHQGFMVFEMAQFPFGPFPVDEPLEEKVAFFDWGQLHEILRNPRKSPDVRRMLRDIRRQLLAQDLYREIAAKINSGQVYELVHAEHSRYVFQAPAAAIDGYKLLLTGGAGDGEHPVSVIVFDKAGSLYRTFRSRQAELEVSRLRDDPWGRSRQVKPMVSVTLKDLTVHQAELDEQAEPFRDREYSLGELQIPPQVASRRVDLETLYRHPERFPVVDKQLKALRAFIRLELHPKIVAEIHGRLAYGIGCILLVPIGAALGLIYRGGHILSAFALCCLPAMVLIVMMIMGKQIIGNIRISAQAAMLGKTAIWSGVLLLASLTAYLYGVVLRR